MTKIAGHIPYARSDVKLVAIEDSLPPMHLRNLLQLGELKESDIL